MNTKCLFGFHKWDYEGEQYTLNWVRTCNDCFKKQQASYDMAYGETTWWDYDKKNKQ